MGLAAVVGEQIHLGGRHIKRGVADRVEAVEKGEDGMGGELGLREERYAKGLEAYRPHVVRRAHLRRTAAALIDESLPDRAVQRSPSQATRPDLADRRGDLQDGGARRFIVALGLDLTPRDDSMARS